MTEDPRLDNWAASHGRLAESLSGLDLVHRAGFTYAYNGESSLDVGSTPLEYQHHDLFPPGRAQDGQSLTFTFEVWQEQSLPVIVVVTAAGSEGDELETYVGDIVEAFEDVTGWMVGELWYTYSDVVTCLFQKMT